MIIYGSISIGLGKSAADDVDLHSVEAWILGNRATFAPDKADKKMLAKRAAAEKLAMKRMLLEAKELKRSLLEH